MPMAPALAAAVWPAVIGGGAAVGTGVMASRAQSGASRRATAAQRDSNTQALDFERQRMAEEQRRWEAEQAYMRQRDDEMRRQWDTQQGFERDRFAASEEDRGFHRRLLEEREARAVPYRQASLGALARLPGLTGSGQTAWRSPSNMGRASLGDLARRG